MFQYRAEVIKVVDGDTVWLSVDLGFDVKRRDSFRLYGINAPEMSTEAGVAARQHLVDLLAPGLSMVTTRKDRREKYGRYLATLWVGGEDMNKRMVADGHAIAYMVDANPG
jgi:micrococcal nuclease